MTTVSKIIRIRTVNLLAALFSFAACGGVLAADKHIDVTVSNNKLVFLNSECPDRPSDMGCVMAEHGNSPMISWELSGLGSDQWQFTGLSFSPAPLQDCTVDDFGLSEADRQSGQASTAQVTSGGKRIQIRDRNRNVCQTQYTLHAESNSGVQIDSDPIIDNRGGGNQ